MGKIRYNNPGNLRTFQTNGKWATPFIGEILPPLATPGQEFGFRKFQSLPLGYRALFLVLKSQYLNKGFDTIAKIFPKYAPTSDGNNPQLYIENVEKWSNVNRNKKLNTYSDLIPIVEGITRMENNVLPDKQAIVQGYKYINTPPIVAPPTIDITPGQTTPTPTPIQQNWLQRNKKPLIIGGIAIAVLTTLYYSNEKKKIYS